MYQKRNNHKFSISRYQQERYITDLHDELDDRVSHGADHDDVVQYVSLRVWAHIDFFMDRYPDPREAARRIWGNGARDYSRRQAVQTGSGALFLRVVGRLDGIDVVDAGPSLADRVATSIDLEAALGTIDPRIADGLVLEEQGYTQVEVARMLALSRTYYSRRANAARRELAALGAAA